jgi:hypothetical protein
MKRAALALYALIFAPFFEVPRLPRLAEAPSARSDAFPHTSRRGWGRGGYGRHETRHASVIRAMCWRHTNACHNGYWNAQPKEPTT